MDWAPVLVGTVLFVLLTPGLLVAVPGVYRRVEFASFRTSGAAVAVHTLVFFALYAVLIVVLHFHIYS